jgi:hypothetical protein
MRSASSAPARALASLLALCFVGGCAGGRSRHPDPPPETALVDYWLRRPAVARAEHPDFNHLWNACRQVIQARSFTVDRVDLRGGVMTTFPQVSRQFFELWRNDVGTLPGVLESSLGTVRRSVRLEVRRQSDGTYVAEPKVVIERYAQTERRITSVSRYAEIFVLDPAEDGSRERGRSGIDLPETYWYAHGRDESLERQIMADVRRSLARPSARAAAPAARRA